MRIYLLIIFSVFFLIACSPSQAPQQAQQKDKSNTIASATMLPDVAGTFEGDQGISIYGKLKYPAGFKHFAYVNSDAPKGGTLRLAQFGKFDSLNQFIIRGNPAVELARIYDTLLVKSADEPNSSYGLIAKKVVKSAQAVDFYLREEAHFSDGHPLTAEDVRFSFELLTTKGNPLFRAYYQDVAEVKVLGKHHIRFEFARKNHELAFILGELPVLPRHYWQDKDFQATTLTPPAGSGPYKIASVKAGKLIVYERDKNYWAKDLGVNVGRHNFDRIVIDYYRSEEVLVEAVRGGHVDLRMENSAKRWNTAYIDNGKPNKHVSRLTVAHKNPAGMQGFVFNLRKPIFKDILVRRALQYAFDFEFVNSRFMFSAYKRTNSYFANSDFAAEGMPSKQEKELLHKFKNSLPQEVFTQVYKNNITKGDGVFRDKKQALDLLQKAGWRLQGNKLVDAEGKPFSFSILIISKAMERIVQPFVLNLAQLGIVADIQLVEVNQYINRVQSFDFDMITYVFGQSLAPGNEQRNYWGSSAANNPGSRNVIGIENKAVDYLVEKIIQTEDRDSLISAAKALDRVLLWNYYIIPHFHSTHHRLVYNSKKISPPEVFPFYLIDISTWWSSGGV